MKYLCGDSDAKCVLCICITCKSQSPTKPGLVIQMWMPRGCENTTNTVMTLELLQTGMTIPAWECHHIAEQQIEDQTLCWKIVSHYICIVCFIHFYWDCTERIFT